MATVIFKPTEACNSRCIYCEVVKKTRGPKRMTFKTLELFFRRVNEFLLERPQEEMEIIWHGGEPLILGPGYFERALLLSGKTLLPNRRPDRAHRPEQPHPADQGIPRPHEKTGDHQHRFQL